MVRYLERIYREEVLRVQETPTENPDGTISFDGPHSQPGEFPHTETGQGARNIVSGVDEQLGLGRVGVLGTETGFGPFEPTHTQKGGLHLIWLEQLFGRLGLEHLVVTHRRELGEAYLRGYRRAA